MTGASATAAAFGSSWASRSAAMALRISALSRSCPSISARACPARCDSPIRTSACSRCDRSRLASVCSVTSTLASRSAARKRPARRRAAADELEQPAGVAEPHPGRRLGLGPEGALGMLKRPIALVRPALGDHRHAERQVRDAGDRLIGPAVPPGQLDRLPAPLRPQRERPPARQLCPVCQAGDLQKGPPDPVRHGDAVLEVPVRLLEASRPEFGDAEVDQRQRPQVPAQPEPRRVGGPGGCQQLLRFQGHDWQVAALAGQPQAQAGQYDLRALAPVRGHRRRPRAASARYRPASPVTPGSARRPPSAPPARHRRPPRRPGIG